MELGALVHEQKTVIEGFFRDMETILSPLRDGVGGRGPASHDISRCKSRYLRSLMFKIRKNGLVPPMAACKTMTIREACDAAKIDKHVLWKNEDDECISCAGSLCDALERLANETLARYKGLCLLCVKAYEGYPKEETYDPSEIPRWCEHMWY